MSNSRLGPKQREALRCIVDTGGAGAWAPASCVPAHGHHSKRLELFDSLGRRGLIRMRGRYDEREVRLADASLAPWVRAGFRVDAAACLRLGVEAPLGYIDPDTLLDLAADHDTTPAVLCGEAWA